MTHVVLHVDDDGGGGDDDMHSDAGDNAKRHRRDTACYVILHLCHRLK